ncbi:hypothetical protein FIBSPDRAFT_895917 [Athelia psychrophila]|uniref:Uncharacterized protein n=1 Tax=Athelia psychrophila TaxID=1759441 RepID=A0A166E2K6_9AGAM|nr:hypothetical protein FIBSPDRAFT_895917 [Fibularhizoctonia sp. CBS 109695]
MAACQYCHLPQSLVCFLLSVHHRNRIAYIEGRGQLAFLAVHGVFRESISCTASSGPSDSIDYPPGPAVESDARDPDTKVPEHDEVALLISVSAPTLSTSTSCQPPVGAQASRQRSKNEKSTKVGESQYNVNQHSLSLETRPESLCARLSAIAAKNDSDIESPQLDQRTIKLLSNFELWKHTQIDDISYKTLAMLLSSENKPAGACSRGSWHMARFSAFLSAFSSDRSTAVTIANDMEGWIAVSLRERSDVCRLVCRWHIAHRRGWTVFND